MKTLELQFRASEGRRAATRRYPVAIGAASVEGLKYAAASIESR
jgi:hypothetical protein